MFCKFDIHSWFFLNPEEKPLLIGVLVLDLEFILFNLLLSENDLELNVIIPELKHFNMIWPVCSHVINKVLIGKFQLCSLAWFNLAKPNELPCNRLMLNHNVIIVHGLNGIDILVILVLVATSLGYARVSNLTKKYILHPLLTLY